MPNEYGEPQFDPVFAIEGYTDSPVWIVGLNPKAEKPTGGLRNPMHWQTNVPADHNWCGIAHFDRLKTIFGKYACRLGVKAGIATTDIVKCASPSFKRDSRESRSVNVCKDFLREQLEKYHPKLIVVVGRAASEYIEELAGNCDGEPEPVGELRFGGHSIKYVLSGYTGYQME